MHQIDEKKQCIVHVTMWVLSVIAMICKMAAITMWTDRSAEMWMWRWRAWENTNTPDTGSVTEAFYCSSHPSKPIFIMAAQPLTKRLSWLMILTQDSRYSKKSVQSLVDLTVAFDTEWLRRHHLNLLHMISDSHMISFIMELLTIHSLKLRLVMVRWAGWDASICRRDPHSPSCSLTSISAMSIRQTQGSTGTLTILPWSPQTRARRNWDCDHSWHVGTAWLLSVPWK